MLKLQKFLENRKPEDLKNDPFNLHISEKNDLILFKYNQFNSDFSHRLVKESRGIILKKDTWEIICHPFHKFWNLGETYADTIDSENSYVISKLDGSLIKIFYYNNKWHVATNGAIDAADAFNLNNISFKELFFDIISEKDFYNLTNFFETDVTYLFELIHPSNQIIVDYKNKKELVFIGMKENNCEMKDLDIFNKIYNKYMKKAFKKFPMISFPKKYDLKNIEDLKDLIIIADKKNKSGNEFEGFVVCSIKNDEIIGRIKIKSPKYVNLHHITTGNSIINNLINIILKNEESEFEVYLEKLPHQTKIKYSDIKKKYYDLLNILDNHANQYRKKADQISRKDLALDIQKNIKKKYIDLIFKLIDDRSLTAIDLIKKYYNRGGIKKIKSIILD